MEKVKIKVLFYNWAPLKAGIGGGVGVYMHNLMEYLITPKNSVVIPVFLSAGYYYDLTRQPYIIKCDSDVAVESYHLVNSPITAPLETMVTQMEKITSDYIVTQLFETFLQEHGPFDIVHFHSFEGISPNVLQLKKKKSKD